MRKSLGFSAVLALVLLVLTPAAHAVQCYQCDNMYNSCMEDAVSYRDAYIAGCNSQWPAGSPGRANCLLEAQGLYNERVADCNQLWEYCSEGCDGPHIPKNGCPIVIDLGKQGVDFTALADGVWFDLTADGTVDFLSWTEASSPDGFLVLDRNGNGRIDSGAELFGDSTPQPDSDTPHGFLALAVYDANGDGAISSDDDVFGDLRVWTDANHNGFSEASELRDLSSLGIASIDLDYRTSRRSDRHGNHLRYRSRVTLEDGKKTDAIDVFFQLAW